MFTRSYSNLNKIMKYDQSTKLKLTLMVNCKTTVKPRASNVSILIFIFKHQQSYFNVIYDIMQIWLSTLA